MDMRSRPYRSVLYIPGSKERALDKARGLLVHAMIFTLVAAVTLVRNAVARATLAAALANAGKFDQAIAVRNHGGLIIAQVKRVTAAGSPPLSGSVKIWVSRSSIQWSHQRIHSCKKPIAGPGSPMLG